MKSKSYKDLLVWQKSIDLAEGIYELTNQLPKQEAYGICSQMQRASVSISSNIAEGQQRAGINEFKQFISIAQGSAAELETQLTIVERIYKLETTKLINDAQVIQKMLAVLRKNIL